MYEHLRRGLRNQIPKFEIGASFSLIINPYITQGSGILLPYNPQPITTNPLPDLNVNLTDYIQLDLKRLQQEYEAKLFSTPAGSDSGGNTGGSGKSKINQLLNKGLNSAKDYLVLNAGQIANFGLNAANTWATSGVEQGGFMKSINGVNNFINSIPVGDKFKKLFGTFTTGLNVINKLGGSYVSKYQADQNLMANMGSSYGGFSDLALRAADATGKTYGLFNGGGKRRAKRLKNEAVRQENIVSDINSIALDLFAMAGNDLNYTRYLFNLNGGWNLNLMRAAKFGSKLERIRRITSKKPVEPVEEFAEDLWEPQLFLSGGKTLKVDNITGAAPKITFESWYVSVPRDRISDNYDLKKAFEVLPFSELEAWRTSSVKDLIDGKNHLRSIYKLPNGEYEFLKLGNELTNPEVHWETDTCHSGENGLKNTHDLVFEGDRYFYRKKKFKEGGTIEENTEDVFLEDSWEPLITELKEGGNLSDKLNETDKEETNLKNIIPEGALHKEKHHMENSEDLTKKGIPVIDNDGVQLAEIERDEIVFTLEVTKKLEDLYHKYYDLETSKKDDLAIEAGKILVYEILYNTEDRTGLISKCKEGGKLNET